MTSTSDVSEGPVLTVLTNRIRNLRKKLNRITQIEQSNQIKNKKQQDLVLSKPGLLAVVEELEKLRIPLTAAVDKELKNTVPEKIGNNNVGCDDVSKTVGGGDDVAGKIGEVVEHLLKVVENPDVTYAALREKLAKIIGSYYYKITLEMKAPAEAAAESSVFVQAESEVEQKEDMDQITRATHSRSNAPLRSEYPSPERSPSPPRVKRIYPSPGDFLKPIPHQRPRRR